VVFWTILVLLGEHVLLLLFEPLPKSLVLLGLCAHGCYFQLLKGFPFLQLLSANFLLSLAATIATTVGWLRHFASDYHSPMCVCADAGRGCGGGAAPRRALKLAPLLSCAPALPPSLSRCCAQVCARLHAGQLLAGALRLLHHALGQRERAPLAAGAGRAAEPLERTRARLSNHGGRASRKRRL
jgi:hypothetical protein